MSDPEIVPEDVEREETLAYGREVEIASLEGHTAITVLRAALAEAEAAMQATVGRNVMQSGKAVNQRQLDYTRGYYDGARHWLHGRIAVAAQRVALEQAKQAGDYDPRALPQDIDPRTGEPRDRS